VGDVAGGTVASVEGKAPGPVVAEPVVPRLKVGGSLGLARSRYILPDVWGDGVARTAEIRRRAGEERARVKRMEAARAEFEARSPGAGGCVGGGGECCPP